MAEIAIAVAISAAVAAASYTVQYALTPKAKPIEKGRLSGDIQIQDSRYGHMIPILLGSSPAAAAVGCDPAGFTSPVVTDSFTRADNSTSLGTAPSGQTWTNLGTGNFGIFGNQAVWDGTGYGLAVVETGESDVDVSVITRLTIPAGESLHTIGIVLRWVDVNNNMIMYHNAGQGYRLYITVAGVQEGGYFGVTELNNFLLFAGDKMRAVICGTVIKAYHNDTLVYTLDLAIYPAVVAALAGGTKHGIAETDGYAATFDDFSVKKTRQIQVGEGGGMRVGGNVIYMSDVRKVETITPAAGGKGFGNKNPDTKNISYFCDLGIMFSEGEMDLAKLFAGTDLLISRTTAGATGVRDPLVEPDPNADNILLSDPSDATISQLPALRYGQTLTPDANGTLTGTLTGGADFRFYSGSETQLPDPLIEAHFGVGNTPAYLGRSYIVLENFEVGKYGAIPNFTAILNNLNLITAADCIDHLCQRVGLDPADFDVSNVNGFRVRGIPITNREPPSNTVGLIGTLFGFDVVETNGEIVCIERGGAPSFAITDDDLGTVEVEDTADPQDADIPEQVQNELQLDQTASPRRLDLTFFDPARDGETNTQGASRLEALANGFVTQEVNAVLTVTEGRQLAQRLLDAAWIESTEAIRFKVPHTFAAGITAAAVGTVTRNGITHTVRVKEVNGFVPGVLECVGTVTRAASYTQTQIAPGADAGSPIVTPTPPGVPATTVATLIDRILRDRELQDGRPGFYVAACSFGNGSWGGCNVYCDRGAGYVQLVNVPEQATMGIVNATPATVAGTSTIDVELYGEQTLPSYTSGEVTGGAGYVMQGSLVYQYQTATQLSTSPNLWRLTVLSNIGAKCTTAEQGAHAAGERFVVLNTALRFISVESSEIGVARNYKVPTVGQDINDAGVISFTLTAPNVAVTTPADWTMTAGAGQITHSWTPFSDECVMSDGLIYEIRDDLAGSPDALLYSGNSQPYKETGLDTGTYTRHFRARTRFADGAYLMGSIVVTASSGSDANFDLILIDPTTMAPTVSPTTMNILTEF
jgi:hypothetical protein